MEDQTPTSHLPTDPAGRIVTQSSSTYHPKRSTLDISGTATVATEHPGTKGGPRWAAWQSAEGQDGTAHGEGRPVVCCDVHRLYFWVLSCDPHPFKPSSAEREREITYDTDRQSAQLEFFRLSVCLLIQWYKTSVDIFFGFHMISLLAAMKPLYDRPEAGMSHNCSGKPDESRIAMCNVHPGGSKRTLRFNNYQ